ncbi:MAG TPA: flagellar hook-basal body complex protein FliE [Bryobacteraceae bacterium]|jgi:flagellar hook-basal body complex protein FliE|nr:flagellar hook-basal body complex protein FliE [Bryobacteraceae bacterium]
MAAPILPAHLSIAPITAPTVTPSSTASGGAFQSAFSDAVSKVEQFQQNANASVEKFLSGEGEELHHVAIATEQADLSFQLFMQVRNKVVTAYQQVMQMQV